MTVMNMRLATAAIAHKTICVLLIAVYAQIAFTVRTMEKNPQIRNHTTIPFAVPPVGCGMWSPWNYCDNSGYQFRCRRCLVKINAPHPPSNPPTHLSNHDMRHWERMAGEFRPPAPGEVGVFVWDRRQCNHVQQGGNPFSVHMLQPDHLQHVRPHQRTIIPNMPQPQHMNVGYQRGPNGSMTPQANEPPNVISARNALNKEITEANRNYNILSNKVAQLRDKYESAQRTLSTTHERHAYEIARRNKDAAEKEYDKAAKDLGMQHVRAELSIQKANASLQLAIARWHLNVIKSIEQTENTKQESQVASLSSSAQEKRHTFETTANPHEKERARQEMVKAEGLFNEASEKLNHHKSYFHQAIQKESANVNLRIAIHRLDSTRLDFMLKDQQAVSENTKIVMDIDRLENEKVREVNPEKIAAYENEIRYKRSLLDDATAKLDYERYKAEFHLSTIKTDVDWRRALLVLNTLRYDTLVERQTIENHIKTQILHIARLNYNKSVERDPNKLAALEHDISTKNADVGNQKLILNHKIHHANFEDRRAFTYAQWLEYIKIREQMRYDAFIANEKETEGIKETEKQVYTLQSHRPDPNNKEEMRTWTTHLATYEDMLANQRFGQSISKDLATLQYNYTQADAALHDIIHLKAMRELEYENITVTIKKECELLQNETAELKISLSHENNSALIRELSDQLGKKESDLQEKTTILNMIGDIAKQDMLVLDAHITWLKHAKEVEDKKYQGALNTREDRVKLHELVVKFNRLKLEQPDPNNYPLIEQWRRNVHSAEVDLNNRTKEVDGKIQNQFAETKVAEDLAHAAKGKYDEAKNIRLQLIEETQKNEAYANKLPKNIMTAEIKVDPVSLPETNINGEDSQQTLPNNTESTNQSKNENTRNEHSNKPPQDEHKPGIGSGENESAETQNVPSDYPTASYEHLGSHDDSHAAVAQSQATSHEAEPEGSNDKLVTSESPAEPATESPQDEHKPGIGSGENESAETQNVPSDYPTASYEHLGSHDDSHAAVAQSQATSHEAEPEGSNDKLVTSESPAEPATESPQDEHKPGIGSGENESAETQNVPSDYPTASYEHLGSHDDSHAAVAQSQATSHEAEPEGSNDKLVTSESPAEPATESPAEPATESPQDEHKPGIGSGENESAETQNVPSDYPTASYEHLGSHDDSHAAVAQSQATSHEAEPEGSNDKLVTSESPAEPATESPQDEHKPGIGSGENESAETQNVPSDYPTASYEHLGSHDDSHAAVAQSQATSHEAEPEGSNDKLVTSESPAEPATESPQDEHKPGIGSGENESAETQNVPSDYPTASYEHLGSHDDSHAAVAQSQATSHEAEPEGSNDKLVTSESPAEPATESPAEPATESPQDEHKPGIGSGENESAETQNVPSDYPTASYEHLGSHDDSHAAVAQSQATSHEAEPEGSNDKLVTSESPAEPATESPAEPATESPQDEHKPGIGSGENESAETQNVPSDYPTASYEHLGSHDDSHAAVAQSQATSHEAEPEGSNDKLVTSESPAEPATESPQDEHKPGIGSGENESAETQNVPSDYPTASYEHLGSHDDSHAAVAQSQATSHEAEPEGSNDKLVTSESPAEPATESPQDEHKPGIGSGENESAETQNVPSDYPTASYEHLGSHDDSHAAVAQSQATSHEAEPEGSNDKLVTSESPAEPATESPAEPATESPQDEHKPGIGSGENESAETQNVPSDYPTASYEHLGSHDDSHAAVAQSQATSHEAEPEGSNDKLVTSESPAEPATESPAEPATESPAEPATESPQDEHKPGIGSGENESAETQNVRAIPHHGPEQGSSSNAPNSMKNHVSTSYQASDRMPVGTNNMIPFAVPPVGCGMWSPWNYCDNSGYQFRCRRCLVKINAPHPPSNPPTHLSNHDMRHWERMAGEFRPPAPGEVGVFVWDRRQCNHVQQGGNPFSVHMLQPDHLQHVRPHQRTIIPNMPQPQHMNVGYQRGPNGSMTPQANEPPNVISARNALNKEITEANRNYNILSNKVAQLRDKYESAQRTLSTTNERHAYEIARRNKDAAEKEYDKAAKDLGMQHVRAELSIQKANASLQLAIARWHLNVIKSIEQTENTKQESQVASLSSSAQEKRHTFETTANPHEKERARQEMVKAEGLFNEASEKLNHHKSYFHQAIQKESANVNLRIAIHRLDSTRLDFMLKDQQAVSENTKIVMDIDRLENEKVREVNPEKIAAYENEIRYKRSLLDDATAKLDYERYKAEFHLSTIKTDVDWRRALLVLNTLRYDTLVERQTIENHIKTQILHIARLNYNKSVERDPNKLAALEHDISTKNADVGNQKLILNHKIHHANFEDRRAFTYAQWLEYIKIREQMRYDAFIANEKETEGIKETEKQVYTLQSHRPDPNNKEEMRTWTTHLATYEDMLANQRFGQSISKDLATLQYNYTQADAALHDIIHLKAMRELEYENITVTIKKECELLQNETAELKISLSHENNSALIRELSDQLGKKESDLQEKTTILNMIGDIAKQDMLVLDAHITWLKHAKEVEDKKYQGALNTREDRVKLHELVVKFNRLKLEQPDPNNYPLIEQWRRNVHSAEVDLNNRTKEVDGKIQNQFAETKVAEDLAHAAKGKYDEAKNIRLQLIEETQKNEAYANKLPKNIMTAEIKVDPVSLPETNINGEDSQQTLPNNTESTNQSKNENTRNEHSNKPPQDEHKPGIGSGENESAETQNVPSDYPTASYEHLGSHDDSHAAVAQSQATSHEAEPEGSNDKLVTSESPAEPATESPQDEHKPGIGSGENESAETQNVPSDYPTASYEHLGSHDDSHAAVAQSQATSHEAEPEGSNDKLVTSESPAEPATESPQDEHKPGIGSGENESAETQNVRAIPHHGPEQGSSSNAPNSMKNHVSTSYQASDRMPVVSTSFDSNIREHSSLAENDFIQNTGKSDVNDTFNMIHHSTTAPGNVISGDIISAEDDSLNPDKTNSTMNEVTTTADYDEDLDELRLTNLLDKVKAEMETKASHDHLREHVLHGSKAVSSENKVSHNPELLKLETHPTPEETGTDNDSTTHLDSRFRSNNKASPFIVPDVVQTTTEEEVIFDTDSSRRHVSNGLKIAGGVIGFILLAAVGTATYYKRKIPAKTQEEISFDVYDDSEIEHSERVETVVKLSDNVWA